MPKYIFLDIDGVMSTSGHKKVQCEENQKISLNVRAVEALNEIIRATDAKIVITSTYKRQLIIGEIRQIFIANGVDDCVQQATANIGTREEEILNGIGRTKQKNEGYLILDDMALVGLGEHFLQINGGTLSVEHVEKCIEILSKPMVY